MSAPSDIEIPPRPRVSVGHYAQTESGWDEPTRRYPAGGDAYRYRYLLSLALVATGGYLASGLTTYPIVQLFSEYADYGYFAQFVLNTALIISLATAGWLAAPGARDRRVSAARLFLSGVLLCLGAQFAVNVLASDSIVGQILIPTLANMSLVVTLVTLVGWLLVRERSRASYLVLVAVLVIPVIGLLMDNAGSGYYVVMVLSSAAIIVGAAWAAQIITVRNAAAPEESSAVTGGAGFGAETEPESLREPEAEPKPEQEPEPASLLEPEPEPEPELVPPPHPKPTGKRESQTNRSSRPAESPKPAESTGTSQITEVPDVHATTTRPDQQPQRPHSDRPRQESVLDLLLPKAAETNPAWMDAPPLGPTHPTTPPASASATGQAPIPGQAPAPIPWQAMARLGQPAQPSAPQVSPHRSEPAHDPYKRKRIRNRTVVDKHPHTVEPVPGSETVPVDQPVSVDQPTTFVPPERVGRPSQGPTG